MASPSTSAPSTTSSTTVDVTARRSCRRCTRKMSSLTHDKHTICVTCRDVDCSVAVRCDECREWSTESMNGYVCHKRSLISKSREPKVTTPSASSASVTPSESPSLSQVVTPSPPSLADDEKLKNYVHSFLASMLSQQSGQVSLGSNPFVSAPSVEVPYLPPRGSTGGKTTESLSSRSIESPGVVPLPPQDDVMAPTYVSVSRMSSVGLAGVSGVPSPSLGVSDPISGRQDQLRDRGDVGFTRHIVSADVHHVPRSLSSFDPTSLLFPFSDSGFSLSSSTPPSLSSFLTSLSSSFSVASSTSLSSSMVPICSLPSVVPSILSTSLPSSPPLPHSSSFSVGPPLGFSSGSYPSCASFLASSAPSFPRAPLSTPLSSAPATSLGALPFSSASSVPSSSSPLDFVAYRANVLGLSAEYQALGRWYFASGGKDFPAYLSAYFPHLYSDFRLDFSSGLSRFLSALSSAPPPVQVPVAPAPSHLVSSLTPSFSGPSSSFSSFFSLPSAAFPFFTRPVAPAPSAPLPSQAPSLSYPPEFHPSLSSSPSQLRSSSGFPVESSHGALVAVGLGVAALSDSQGVSSTPSFFRPFVSSLTTPSVHSAPSAPPLSSSSAGVPPSTSSVSGRILLRTQFRVFWIRIWLRCLRLPVRSFVVC